MKTNNKLIEFGLTYVDKFIIRVGFELMNIDIIRILIRHEHDPSTRIATPKWVGICDNPVIDINLKFLYVTQDGNGVSRVTRLTHLAWDGFGFLS